MPLNLDYRGGLLAHAVALSDAQVIVADPTLVPRLAEIDRAGLSTLVTLGAPVAAPPGLRALGPEALAGDPLARELESDAPAAAAQPPDEPGGEAEEKGGCACIVM